MGCAYSVGDNKITVTSYSLETPCTFTTLHTEDKAGTLSLHARTGITGTDGAAVAVDRAERPTDYVVLGGASNDLYITIANWVGTTATIQIVGTDRDSVAQTEDIVVNANGNYYTTKWFKTITHTQVTVFTATGFDYCYSKDTEILTEEGWKLVKDVKVGELVWTLNPDNQEMELDKVKRKISYSYKGKMYHQKSPFFDLLTTPNHRNYVQRYLGHGKFADWELKAAEDLPKDVKYKRNAIWKGKELKNFVLPSSLIRKDNEKKSPLLEIQMDLWLKFLGIYLSERCVTLRKNKSGSNTYCVCLSQSEKAYPENCEEIGDILNQLPFKYRQDKNDKGVINFTIFNKQLYDYLKQFGKSKDKFIPKEILSLDSRQLRILFHFLMVGDGWGEQGKGGQYGTISKQLAADFQELVLKIGLASSIETISPDKHRGFKTKNDFYRILICFKNGLEPRVNRGEESNLELVDYDDTVHCVEIEKNHIVYVRRNGKPVWSGNCLTQGQWGVMWKNGIQFRLDCDLQINGWLADIEKEITVNKADGRFFMNSSGVFRLGTKLSNYEAKEGCTLIFTNPDSHAMYFTSGRCLFYDSVIDYDANYMGATSTATSELICCTVKNTGMLRWKGSSSIIYRLTYTGGSPYGLNPLGNLLLLEDVFVHNRQVGYYFYPSAGNSKIKNLKTLNVTYGILVFGVSSSPGATGYAYVIDSVLENWNFSYPYGYYGDSKIYRQYTINLKVIDKNNNDINDATVTLWDKDNNEIFSTTTSSGVIAGQTVSYGYYDEPHASTIQPDDVGYSPHTLQISKAGYQTYKTKFTLDSKIDWTIKLFHSPYSNIVGIE